ncbi:UNVERIFIED_CONTAM: hypothetical protein RKD50_000564 [Streptomyces canus]
MATADGGGMPKRLTRAVESIRIRLESGQQEDDRRQPADEQRKLTASFLPTGETAPTLSGCGIQFEGAMWRFRTGAQ